MTQYSQYSRNGLQIDFKMIRNTTLGDSLTFAVVKIVNIHAELERVAGKLFLCSYL